VASAQATRTWVSGVGDDVNPCSRTAPCKTFAGAISKTAKNGIINVIDPGGFGAVTITKSITIDGTPFLAGVLGAGTNGITVNITDPTDTASAVILRGLDIEGITTGLSGVNILSAKRVIIDHCNIFGYSTAGVRIVTSAALPTINVMIRNSAITNNTDGVNSSGPTLVHLELEESTVNGNSSDGVDMVANTTMTATHTDFSNNVTSGINNEAASNDFSLAYCSINQNATGVLLNGGGTGLFYACQVNRNTTASMNSSNARTAGNNTFADNGANTVPAVLVPVQ
jgi:hypothetical protein